MNDWIDENLFLGTEMPVSQEDVKVNLVNAVTKNPAFGQLHNREDYKLLERKLKNLMG